MNDVSADAIRAHVARITSNELFAGAERLCRFLRFTVEEMLGGRDGHVKEYVIGREVFDRGDEYDPRIDPIVRVEARRLRSRLIEYYSGPGRNEPLRVEYPKGRYVPVVSPVGPVAEKKRRPLFAWWPAAAFALAFVTTMGAALILRHPANTPVLAPIPASWIQPDRGTLDTVDVTLAEDVDAELANQPHTRVVAWPEIVRNRVMRLLALNEFASLLGADQLVIILARNEVDGNLLRVFVVEEPAGLKRLALTYVHPALSTPEEQRTMAARIARDLASARRE